MPVSQFVCNPLVQCDDAVELRHIDVLDIVSVLHLLST
jgi:hypothetical protein